MTFLIGVLGLLFGSMVGVVFMFWALLTYESFRDFIERMSFDLYKQRNDIDEES